MNDNKALIALLDAWHQGNLVAKEGACGYVESLIEAGEEAIKMRTTFDIYLDEEASALLRDTIGEGEASVVRIQFGDGHSGPGLYVSLAEHPEEGSIKLWDAPPKNRTRLPTDLPAVGEAMDIMDDAVVDIPPGAVEALAKAISKVEKLPPPDLMCDPEFEPDEPELRPVLTADELVEMVGKDIAPMIDNDTLFHNMTDTQSTVCEVTARDVAVARALLFTVSGSALLNGDKKAIIDAGMLYRMVCIANNLLIGRLATQPALPDGLVLMPREPSEQELMRAQGALMSVGWDATTCFAARVAELYRVTRPRVAAMLAASPTAPEGAALKALKEYYLSDAPFVADRMRDAIEKAGVTLPGYTVPPTKKEQP